MYRILCEIKVVNEDGNIVDHRGYEPKKNDRGQICSVNMGSFKDLSEANKMMNATHAVVDTIADMRNINNG